MSSRDVVEGLRSSLVAAGLVRDPDSAGALPPMWLSPRSGLNAPNEGSKPQYKAPVVVGAELAPAIPSRAREGFVVNTCVDLTFRAMSAPDCLDIGDAVRRHLVDRVNWQMGAVLVSQVQETVQLQPLSSDEQGFRYRSQYTFTWQDFQLAADRGWG
jgi:hypothetical protein